MTLSQALQSIQPPCEASIAGAARRFEQIAAPLGALGLLQDAVIQLAGAQGKVLPEIDRRAVVVFCADNGVVAQGVTQCGQEVTATVAENLSRDMTSVCLMAKHENVEVIPVDIGVARTVGGAKLIDRKIAFGTKDMTLEPAMTREEAVRAIEVGIEMAGMCAEKGIQILCAGEMGIGNTTSSAAVTAALLGVEPVVVTGRGAGLSSEGLERKVHAIERALERAQIDAADPVTVLSEVGGFDIAGMAGLYIGGALHGIPSVVDGVIAQVAALVAVRMCPDVRGYLLFSHKSAEPASRLLLAEMDAKPYVDAGMRLGEGTGAVAGIALLDLGLAVYRGMPAFDDIEIDAYVPLS